MQVIPLSRNDTLGDMKNKTLVAVYQLQLELVNVNPADIHWQAQIHMRRVKRHTQTRAGKRQGNRDVLAPLLEQQLPALPGLPSLLMSGCSAAVKGAMLTPASAAAPPAVLEKLGGKGIERRKESFPLFPCPCLCALGCDGSLASHAEAASLAPVGLWLCAGEEMVPRRLGQVK